MSRDLATLASAPERVQDLPADLLPQLIGEVEALKARLWARLRATGGAGTLTTLCVPSWL